MFRSKIAALALSLALIAAGSTASNAATAPSATVTALHKLAVAPASTERLLSMPRIFSRSASWDNQYGCTPVVFIAARGSSESSVIDDVSFATNTTKLFSGATPNVQLGRTLDALLHSVVASKLPETGPSNYSYRGVGPVANMAGYGAHSAIDDFFGSLAPFVAQGAKAALATILQTADVCTSSKFVLVGYSQGATIMRAAASRLSQNDNAFFSTRILATLLIGDPSTNATGSVAADSLAKSLNTAMAPVSSGDPLPCPQDTVQIGQRCVTRDGFVPTFGNGAWANKANYRPLGWPMLNTGDTADATTLANSGNICLERDAICNTSVVQTWNASPLSASTLAGHEVYLDPSTKALPNDALAGFVPALQTWLAGKGVWNASAIAVSAAPSVKLKKATTTSSFRVCPAQSSATLAISSTNGFPSREGSSACNYLAGDKSGALFFELARTKTDLAKSTRKLVSYVGAPAVNWKTLPKNRTKVAFLRVTNSKGVSSTIQVALPLW